MQVHAEYQLTGKSLQKIISTLKAVIRNGDGWSTNLAKNASYSQLHGERCYWLIAPIKIIGQPAAVAFAGEKRAGGNARMKVTNILPIANSELSTDEYNQVLCAVQMAVSNLKSEERRGVRVKFDSGQWTLDKVIPGTIARKKFIEYLHGHPRTFHPSDLGRLDLFIVAVFRTRTQFEPYLLRQYLMEDLKWSARDADIVHERVVVGLQVLNVNRRY